MEAFDAEDEILRQLALDYAAGIIQAWTAGEDFSEIPEVTSSGAVLFAFLGEDLGNEPDDGALTGLAALSPEYYTIRRSSEALEAQLIAAGLTPEVAETEAVKHLIVRYAAAMLDVEDS